jgi:hypothetical protein
MRTERAQEKLLLNYLLGHLSNEEQARVEDRAFADAGYLDALEAAEADLIDSYVRGELSQADRRQFEQRFLASPQRRGKVEFARTLARVAAESHAARPLVPARPSPWQALADMMGGWSPALRFAAAAGVLLCVAGASWLVVHNASMRARVAALEAQRRNLESREQALQQKLSEERARAAQGPGPSSETPRPPLLASLVFVPGLSRAESSVQRLVLDPSVQLARIEIQLEPRDDFPRFRAELRTRRGEEVFTQSNLRKRQSSGGSVVTFDVPATALAVGEYELALKGLSNGASTDIGYYYFHVER